MSSQGKAQQIEVVPKAELVEKLARYLEQQPESVRAADKVMKGLEAVSLVLPIAGLITAIVLIVTGSASLNQSIPAAIFAVLGCFTPWMFLLGLHSVLIRAFPAHAPLDPPSQDAVLDVRALEPVGPHFLFRVSRQVVPPVDHQLPYSLKVAHVGFSPGLGFAALPRHIPIVAYGGALRQTGFRKVAHAQRRKLILAI